MPVPMSGRRANFPGSTPHANALGSRHNRVEVLPQPTLQSFDSYDSVASPGRPALSAKTCWSSLCGESVLPRTLNERPYPAFGWHNANPPER